MSRLNKPCSALCPVHGWWSQLLSRSEEQQGNPSGKGCDLDAGRQEDSSQTLWIQQKIGHFQAADRPRRCMKLGWPKVKSRNAAEKGRSSKALARVLSGVSHGWPAAKMCVVCPTPLYLIFLLRIVLWIHFWSVEACPPELVDSHVPLFTMSLCKPLSFQPGPSWQDSEFGTFGTPAKLTLSSEPRMLEGYLKTTSNSGPQRCHLSVDPGDLFSVPCLYSLVCMAREASLALCLKKNRGRFFHWNGPHPVKPPEEGS